MSVARDKKTRSAEPHASRLYSHLAPAYKAVWPKIARRNIRRAIGELDISAGTKILDVGVGTGLSLEIFPHDVDVTGIDLSESMLAEAQSMILQRGWEHVRLLPMNAEQLEFDDSQFDLVTSFHTISVVSDPRAMMSEMLRVCRPGGTVLLINHFRSGNPMIAKVVDSAGNLTKRLGWRTDLDLESIIQEMPLTVQRRYKPNPLSLFTIMQATCEG